MTRERERSVAGDNLGDDQDYIGLSDEELRRAVLEHLQADQTVDATDVEVVVDGGRVRLAGRVGGEVERETAERIVRDVIGLEVAATLRVETTAREGARAADVPTAEVAMGEPDAAGADYAGESEVSEAIGTDDAREASDEGRSWTPPDAPVPEATAATDLAEGVARDTGVKRRGRRPPRLEEAIARTLREAPEGQARQVAAENASAFKERMRAVAEERDRAAAERARRAREEHEAGKRRPRGRSEP